MFPLDAARTLYNWYKKTGNVSIWQAISAAFEIGKWFVTEVGSGQQTQRMNLYALSGYASMSEDELLGFLEPYLGKQAYGAPYQTEPVGQAQPASVGSWGVILAPILMELARRLLEKFFSSGQLIAAEMDKTLGSIEQNFTQAVHDRNLMVRD